MKIRKLLLLLTLLVTFAGTISSPSLVFAESGNVTFNRQEQEVKSSAYLSDETSMSFFMQLAKEANREVGREVLSYDGPKKVIYFDNGVYRDMYLDERTDFMKFALTMVRDSKINSKGKNKIYNFLTSQDSDSSKILRNLEKDVTADIASGKDWYEPFNGPITTILGLVALGVFILTGVSFVLDLAYLFLPPVRSSVDNHPDGKLPRVISPQAYYAARHQDSLGIPSYLWFYLTKRFVAVAILFIALGYLNSGMIFDLIGNFIQVFSDAFTW